MTAAEIALTAFLRAEVGGLLDVCNDEPEMVTWGLLTYRGRRCWLTVLDPVEAADDLRHRADFLVDEGGKIEGRSGVAGATSLRRLATLIEGRGATPLGGF